MKGDFTSEASLSELEGMDIDAVVHLAAVTGGCSERDGILVNVEGTRLLIQHLSGMGCRKIVLASSIAAIGFQRTDFMPDELPITEAHGCSDIHGYGLSKYLMEEVLRYLSRQKPELDIIALRLASVPAKLSDAPGGSQEYGMWALGGRTCLALEDAITLFSTAVSRDYNPGLLIVNGIADECWSTVPTTELIRSWWGDRIDASYYQRPENEYASFFDTSRLKRELGFTATKTAELIKIQRTKH